MKRNRCIHIYDEFCRRNFFVYYGTTEKFLVESVKENLGIDIEKPNSGGRCLLVEHGNGYESIVIWTFKKKPCLLAHEAIHAARFIFDLVGIKDNGSHDETLNYYVEMLVRKTLDEF